MKRYLFIISIGILILILGIGGWFLVGFLPKNTENSAAKEQRQTKLVDFTSLSTDFLFSAYIPSYMEVEYLPNKKAINVYDPKDTGSNNLEKSKMYISFFRANTFLTLNTVTISQALAQNIKGREAILYEITKKSDVLDFVGQPSWRNNTHKALDIRYSKGNPTYFYSFAYDPMVSEATFNQFIDSLEFYN